MPFRASPDDRFHVIGFTQEDILADTASGVTGLSMLALAKIGELYQRFGSLTLAARRGRVVKERGEVYFLSRLAADEALYVVEPFSNRYQAVFFFNDSALRICADNQIALPPVIQQVTRASLPQGVGVAARFPTYALVG